jgi:ribosome-associated translation inhibitor RaiA
MKVAPVITFRNLSRIAWIEEDIHLRVQRLEARCTDLTACRVLVSVPHRHHRHGNRFHIRIDVTMRGQEIAVSHTPDLHARQQDLREAAQEKRTEIEAMRKDGRLVLRQAFDKVTRQLRHYARRVQSAREALADA